jgi:hypothetical protein
MSSILCIAIAIDDNKVLLLACSKGHHPMLVTAALLSLLPDLF